MVAIRSTKCRRGLETQNAGTCSLVLPLPPKGHIPPPDRSHELAAILRAPLPTVRKGWRGELEAAHALFESEVPRETSFLRLEHQLPKPFWDEIAIKAETLMGPDWLRLDAEEVAATILEHCSEWEQMLVDLSDANLFQMSVITAQAVLLKREVLAVHPMERSPLPPVPKKTRLYAKSERPPAYFHSDPATEPAAESKNTGTAARYREHRKEIMNALLKDAVVNSPIRLDYLSTYYFLTVREPTGIVLGIVRSAPEHLN